MGRILTFLAAATVLAAQAPEAGQPVIRVSTRLVEVDVVASDRHGPVTNLTKDDFSVFDNGKPQTVASFEKRSREAVPSRTARESSTGSAVSNRRDSSATYTILLLDQLNSDAMEQHAARDSVLKFLRQVKHQDRVAIYTLGGSVHLEQDFTGDSGLLVKAVQRGRWGAGYLWPENQRKAEAAAMEINAMANARLAALAQAAGTTFLSQNSGAAARHVQQVCIRLIALARHLGRMPGRKNVLWLTHAFPLVEWGTEPKLFAEEISQVNHAFSDAGVAVYPIDTRGLAPPAEISTAPLPSGAIAAAIAMAGPSTGRSQIGGESPIEKGSAALNHVPAGTDTMDFVARYTGGRAFHDSNDISGAIRRAGADADVTYVLGFYADSATLDAKRHTLEVKVARGGIELRHREGYTATVEDPATRMPEKAQITEAIWSPLETAAIALTAKYEEVDQPTPGMLRLMLSIAGSDVTTEPGEGGFVAELALVYDARSAEGRDLGRISQVLNLKYDEEHNRTLSRDGVQYSHVLQPPAGTRHIRVVVYDRKSGRVGSVNVPLI